MRVRFIVAVSAIGALLATAGQAQAWPFGRGGRNRGGAGEQAFDKFLELNLTPEQTELIRKQREENRRMMRELHQAIRSKHRELRDELDRETTDKKKVETIIADLKNLEAMRIDQRVKAITQVKEALTPEQFRKLQSLRDERQRGRRGRRGGKGPRFSPPSDVMEGAGPLPGEDLPEPAPDEGPGD